VEAAALLQNRIGISSLRAFQANVIPFLKVVWIDERSHAAIFELLLAANRRNLSLVDCSSFETMKKFGIERAFTFDEHFREQGFTVIP
jgi:predicted nucleic acid-binding protein